MSDPGAEKDLRDLWRNQPVENIAINLERLVHRRSEELGTSTRLEVLFSLGAALLLLGFVASRLASDLNLPLQLAVAATILWVAISAWRFRRLLWPPKPSSALAATGLAHYRRVLESRRDHLKSAWIWHGPALLAIAILLLTVLRTGFISPERLRNMLPFLALLVLWIVLGFVMRMRQVAELSREIRELGRPD